MRKNSIRFVITFGIVFCLLSGPVVFAKKKEVPVNIPSIPLLSKAPKIDGKIDNPLWEQEALKIENFRQFMPNEDRAPGQKTVAYIGYDKKNLYVAFRAYDTEAGKLRYSITSRDNCMEDDWIVIFIDTFNEKRRAYTFIVNPIGIQMDMMRLEEGGDDNMDDSWDTVFYSDGRVDEQGYTVEISIPFKSIRFPDKENKVWNIVLGRTIARTGEIIMWPTMSRDLPGLISQGTELQITSPVEKGRNFEIMPVATSLKTKGEKLDFSPGINFKWGINSDLTLDMTVNPDFSHIEADAPKIDVNQRFALYYSEKRPFFLEGMEIFRFPEIRMVYTRRINDPIAGAKLTGKVGRFTYGVLSALDTSPTESLWDVSTGGQGKQNALFNIFRVKADVFKESYIGFALTDREYNGSYNRVAGLDGQFKFANKFFFKFQAIGSKTRFDKETTSLAPGLYADFSYSTKHFYAGFYGMAIHPDFEASSGFVNRVDYRSFGIFSGYRIYPGKKYLSQVGLRFNAGRRFGYFDDMMQDQWMRASLQFRLTEFSQIEVEYNNRMEHYSGADFWNNSLEVQGQLLFIKWMPFGFFFQTGDSIYYDTDDPFKGYSNIYGIGATIKPSKRLKVGVDITKQTFWDKWGGETVYDFNVVRTQTTYQFSKTLSVRAIIDYNHFYKQIYGSFLFSYVLRPGTVFFLGLDNNLLRSPGGTYASDNYSIFVKFSYWLRM